METGGCSAMVLLCGLVWAIDAVQDFVAKTTHHELRAS
jgi:hypothetical protein